jgi:hypothetical protein
MFVNGEPIDLFIGMRILIKRIISLECAEMMMLSELRKNPVDEFIAAGVTNLANVENIFPSRFRRVRKNLIRSADCFGFPLAGEVAEKLPRNYFAALWKRRAMA